MSKWLESFVNRFKDKNGSNYEGREMAVSEKEIEIFKNLKGIKVVIDVGAGFSCDYLEFHPNAEYHLFEPYQPCYERLEESIKDKPNVKLNKYGLADKMGRGDFYGAYMITGSEQDGKPTGKTGEVELKTLDWYVKENNIKRIDYLKIDTEGFDYKVLLGAKKALKKTRWLQYEHWTNSEQYYGLLEKDFNMVEIGHRNVLCKRKR